MEKHGNDNNYSNYSQTSCHVKETQEKPGPDNFHDALRACSYPLSLSTSFNVNYISVDDDWR